MGSVCMDLNDIQLYGKLGNKQFRLVIIKVIDNIGSFPTFVVAGEHHIRLISGYVLHPIHLWKEGGSCLLWKVIICTP